MNQSIIAGTDHPGGALFDTYPVEVEALHALSEAIITFNDATAKHDGFKNEHCLFDDFSESLNNPVVFGHLLMQHLDSAMGDGPDHFTTEEKQYWGHVAETLGPDWVGKFRRIGVFMKEWIDA